MKKKCHIYAKSPITCFSVPIVGHSTLNLTCDEIYKCLCSRAEVVEILPNGKSVNLDFSNYNKDNCVKPKISVTEKTEEVVQKIKKELVIVDKAEIENDVKVVEEPIVEEQLEIIEESEEIEEQEIVVEESVEVEDDSEEVVEESIEVEDITEEVEESVEALPTQENPVKTHQVSSRNNNYQKYNNHNKKGKNKR